MNRKQKICRISSNSISFENHLIKNNIFNPVFVFQYNLTIIIYMKKILLAILLSTSIGIYAQRNDINYYIDNAPFKFGKMVLPTIPQKDFNITDFGGVGDGKTLNTEAFAKAINTISENGGGRLIVPAGTWITGPIELKSKIDFHVEANAIIEFTPDRSQYPIREISAGKFDVTPPLWGDNLTDVAFTGTGVFDGSGDAWRPVKKSKVSDGAWQSLIRSGGALSSDGKIWWPTRQALNGEALYKRLSSKKDATAKDYEAVRDYLRPMMFTLSKVKNLLIDGPTFRNSPKFVINPKQITNLVIQNVTVFNPDYAQNGDGIDISASKNVIIYNTTVSAGDDGICMKSSGTPKDGKALLSNMIIAECKVYKAHGGFVIGSNTDGGMENIFVTNCLFDGSDVGVRVKSNSGRGGDVQNIFIDNIFMKNIVHEAISFDTYYADAPVGSSQESRDAQYSGDKVPFFHNFHISNINCTGAETAFFFRGLKDKPVQDIFFKNISVKSTKEIDGEYASNLVFEQVKINGSENLDVPKALKGAVIIKQ